MEFPGTMNLVAFSVLFSLGIGFLWCSRIDDLAASFSKNQPISDDSLILCKIISNYLIKYFRKNRTFVSIIVSASENEPNRFRGDFSHNLVDSVATSGFGYNVLDRLHNSTGDNMKAFNLIVVHDRMALR